MPIHTKLELASLIYRFLPEALQRASSLYRRLMKAVVEASYTWGPMYDWLEEVTEGIVLAHPAEERAAHPVSRIQPISLAPAGPSGPQYELAVSQFPAGLDIFRSPK